MLLDISAGAIMAAVIPIRLRSRISGAYTFVNYGVRVVGALLGGLLGSTIGLRPTLWSARPARCSARSCSCRRRSRACASYPSTPSRLSSCGPSAQPRSPGWRMRTSGHGPGTRPTRSSGSRARHRATSSTSAPEPESSTRSLDALGHHVVAVEPLAEMLDQLRTAVPGVTAVVGSAESLPLPDASADVVVCAQAFHWFDQEPAVAEIARVLRPGGHIALVWNVRDERVPWVADLSDAMVGRTGVERGASAPIERSGLYGEVERATFEHTQDVDREALRELALSRSYCAVLPEQERAPILGRVDALFDAHARDGVLTLPYVVECFRAERL